MITRVLIQWRDGDIDAVNISSSHDMDENDDSIFFYGLSKEELIECVENGWELEGEWTVIEVIGSYDEFISGELILNAHKEVA